MRGTRVKAWREIACDIDKDTSNEERNSIIMFQPIETAASLTVMETVTDVVDLLYRDLSLRDRVTLSNLAEYELDADVYLVMAKTIRKEFGLYSGNVNLLNSCQKYLGTDYDAHEAPAMIIIKELWKKVRRMHRLRLVK